MLNTAREYVRRYSESHEYLDRLSVTDAVFGMVLPGMIDALEVANSIVDTDGRRQITEALKGGFPDET